MVERAPGATIPSPPRGFDGFIRWVGEWSDQLVLLEEIPLEQVRSAVRTTCGRVEEHLRSVEGWERRLPSPDRAAELVTILRSDHRWFESSLQELSGLLAVVEGEDHGGHRQALGQYGRLLAAALVRHRRDELELERLPPAEGTRPLRNAN